MAGRPAAATAPPPPSPTAAATAFLEGEGAEGGLQWVKRLIAQLSQVRFMSIDRSIKQANQPIGRSIDRPIKVLHKIR